MEILGLDPKITICKIAVLPIKLYPLLKKFFFIKKTQAGIEPAHSTVKMLCLNHLTIGPYNPKIILKIEYIEINCNIDYRFLFNI